MDFKSGNIEGVVARKVKKYVDDRGWLVETFRHDEMEESFYPVMAYTSLSHPGVVRGPHEHVDQSDLFLFIGPGAFKIWLWDNRKKSPTFWNRQVLSGGEDELLYLLVPPGVVHAYKNVSQVNALVQNFPNQLFMGKGKKSPIDEIRHEDDKDTVFQLV